MLREKLFSHHFRVFRQGLLLNAGTVDDEMSDHLESKINEVNSWSTSDSEKSVELLCKANLQKKISLD